MLHAKIKRKTVLQWLSIFNSDSHALIQCVPLKTVEYFEKVSVEFPNLETSLTHLNPLSAFCLLRLLLSLRGSSRQHTQMGKLQQCLAVWSTQPLLQLDIPSRTSARIYHRGAACLNMPISLFPGKQSGGWQQQGVSLENNKHQSRKISDCVVLQQNLALHINWIVTERLWFLVFVSLPYWKVASFHFCLVFCCVIALPVSVAHSCSSSSRLLSALPHLTHFVCHWNKRRAFPACRGKTPLCRLCCHGKVDQAADSFGTAATFQFSSTDNISDIQTIAHRIQTALEAGCWRIAESCQHPLE